MESMCWRKRPVRRLGGTSSQTIARQTATASPRVSQGTIEDSRLPASVWAVVEVSSDFLLSWRRFRFRTSLSGNGCGVLCRRDRFGDFDREQKPVAAFGQGLDKHRSIRVVVESLAQFDHGLI